MRLERGKEQSVGGNIRRAQRASEDIVGAVVKAHERKGAMRARVCTGTYVGHNIVKML